MSTVEKIEDLRRVTEHYMAAQVKTPERPLITAMMNLLEELGEQVTELEEHNKTLAEQVEDLTESVEILETLVLDGLEDEESFEEYEIACPNCEETLVIDAEALDSGIITCPSCGKKFEIDLGFEEK